MPIPLYDSEKEIPSGRPYRRTKPFAQVRLEILAKFPPNRPKLLPSESSRLTRNGNISRLKHFSPRTSRRDHQEQCYHLLVLRGRVLNPQSYHSAFRISSTRHLDSRMYCWPALRVRFRLAQNFSGHWSNVALPAENIMDEV